MQVICRWYSFPPRCFGATVSGIRGNSKSEDVYVFGAKEAVDAAKPSEDAAFAKAEEAQPCLGVCRCIGEHADCRRQGLQEVLKRKRLQKRQSLM